MIIDWTQFNGDMIIYSTALLISPHAQSLQNDQNLITSSSLTFDISNCSSRSLYAMYCNRNMNILNNYGWIWVTMCNWHYVTITKHGTLDHITPHHTTPHHTTPHHTTPHHTTPHHTTPHHTTPHHTTPHHTTPHHTTPHHTTPYHTILEDFPPATP